LRAAVERTETYKTIVLPFLMIVLLGLFLRVYGISSQPPLSDEAGVAFSAVHYMEGGQFGPTMWYHPNLRNILIYWMGNAFGYGPYSMRGISLLAGVLSIIAVFAILYILTEEKTASLLAAFFLSVEQVHITFSRQAIQETWTVFFFLLGTLLFVLYAKKDGLWMLVLSGVAFGLGMASKFHALMPLAVCLFYGMRLSWKERSPSKGIFVLACLVALPLAVYLATYVPWFERGYGIQDWVFMQKALLVKTFTHKGNPMDQVIDTKAWQWFLRPMGYANFVHFGGRPFVTVSFSNPFVWLFVLPSAAFLSWKSRPGFKRLSGDLKADGGGIVFLLFLFIASYAPLAFSPRPIWLLSSLAVMPFAFMLVSLAVSEWSESLKWGKKAILGYIIIVFISSLALYPMALGKGKHYGYLNLIVERFRPAHEKMQ
jgi:dolichyl-phosphate-mannose--protein O-mannosyl transferase